MALIKNFYYDIEYLINAPQKSAYMITQTAFATKQSIMAFRPLFLLYAIIYLILLPWIDFPWTTVLKPLPIACLILEVMRQNPLYPQKKLLSLTLLFALLGDMALTFSSPAAFMTGMICFALMHCGYCALFLKHFSWHPKRAAVFAILLVIVGSGYLALQPFMGALGLAAFIYLVFLLSMAFFAFQYDTPSPYVRIGATLFLISDSLLGVNVFVAALHNPYLLTVIVMSCYYAAQWYLTQGCLTRKKSQFTQPPVP